MDLGIDRLVNMIEERFGRTASTVLLLTVFLAVFSWCVSTTYSHLIYPVVNFIGGNYQLDRDMIFSAAVSVFIVSLAAMVYFIALELMARRLAAKVSKRRNST